MDFLDPKKRRAYHIRLMIGYALMAVVIGLATYLLTTAATGYGFNAKTGQVVENGLLFINSTPGGAAIYLNGVPKNANTPVRLILPGGNYTLKLSKTGYRDWTRSFTLNGQSVARYVYPFLFPVKPVITNLKTYASMPGLETQSPSQRWLLVENNAASTTTPTFDEYDTTTLDNTTPTVQQVALPANLLTDYSAASKLTAVEWSTDNNNVLLEHTYGKNTEFVVFDRADPTKSFNVNKLFNVTPTMVNLFNKKTSQLYIYNQTDGSLRLGTVATTQLAAPILKNVLAYKPYGTDLITYVTATGAANGMVNARIWDSGKSYLLYEFNAGAHYLIDAAQFNGHFYYVAGSNTADRINIYKDPLNDLENTEVGKALPMLALRDPAADKIGFSNNAQFIGAESGQKFAVYDLENQNLYQYSLKSPLVSYMSWMDGDRFIGDSGGQVLIADYDGTNSQLITPTADSAGALFSANYRHMLNLAAGSKGAVVFQDVDMRAGTDLPANKRTGNQ